MTDIIEVKNATNKEALEVLDSIAKQQGQYLFFSIQLAKEGKTISGCKVFCSGKHSPFQKLIMLIEIHQYVNKILNEELIKLQHFFKDEK